MGIFRQSCTRLHVQQRLVEPDIDVISRQEKATSRWKRQESHYFWKSLYEMRCVKRLEEVYVG